MILLTPHAEGLFVYVDGVEHFKPMTTAQMLTLAERVIEAAIASSRITGEAPIDNASPLRRHGVRVGEGWDVVATEMLK